MTTIDSHPESSRSEHICIDERVRCVSEFASPSCSTNLSSFLFYFIYSAKKGKRVSLLSINNNSYSIKLSTTVYTTADGSHVQHGQTRKLGWFLGKWIFGGVKSDWSHSHGFFVDWKMGYRDGLSIEIFPRQHFTVISNIFTVSGTRGYKYNLRNLF